MSKEGIKEKTYHVGDEVPQKGDSFEYPQYYDIISLESEAAVLVRDCKIFDIVKLEDYHFTGLPILDTAGFGLQIKTREDMKNYLLDCNQNVNKVEIHKKWAKFETYRRVVSGDNFYMI